MLLRSLLFCALFVFAATLRAQDAEGVHTKFDEPPAPTKTAKPEYPYELKRDGVEGLVAVTCVIDESGNVLSASIRKASHPAFEKPSLEAIQKWKFKPAKKDGKEVKARVTIPFRFNVND